MNLSYRHGSWLFCIPAIGNTKSRELTDTHDKLRSPAMLTIFEFL
ncbi:hypothetical protein [Floridanema evergladense]|uniref:Uncharacterized protein n=1 Tax=Floridaenema evergladense BLCC-F167 TaxID=3153639 RepID=A0ABV4WHF7_9CYAN